MITTIYGIQDGNLLCSIANIPIPILYTSRLSLKGELAQKPDDLGLSHCLLALCQVNLNFLAQSKRYLTNKLLSFYTLLNKENFLNILLVKQFCWDVEGECNRGVTRFTFTLLFINNNKIFVSKCFLRNNSALV